MKNKKKPIIPIICGGIVATVITAVMVVLVAGFPWLIIYLGSMFGEDPPEPAVTYREMPFELVYEINGEKKEVTDTLVITYEGVDWNEGRGKFNVFDVYLMEGNARLVSSSDKDCFIVLCVVGTPDAAELEQEILIYLGNGELYMGLECPSDSLIAWGADVGDIVFSQGMDVVNKTYVELDDEMMEQYNIKLISWKFSEPIENIVE